MARKVVALIGEEEVREKTVWNSSEVRPGPSIYFDPKSEDVCGQRCRSIQLSGTKLTHDKVS